jgi:predicted O-methyltransferase YrrM
MVRRIVTRLTRSATAPGNAIALLRCMRNIRLLHSDQRVDTLADFCFKYPIIPQQVPEELVGLFQIVSALRPRRALEIGTRTGGTLFMTCRVSDPRATIISVDLPGGRFGSGYRWPRKFVYRSFAKRDQAVHFIRKDSHNSGTLALVRSLLQGEALDFLFIDGDHTYAGVRSDFEMYAPLVRSGGLIAFHDIAKHPPKLECDVDRFWNEVKQSYRHLEIVKDPLQGWAGIGVLYA